ncbi:MAG: toll/interleukin-1 receptor domain-containing protein [Mogibacterium sp.]|nr:toll/interleukin-1 receptor domain-containing protein [Mogibacterium sp.]
MFDYDVFISYRHRPLDSAITERVFNHLENYKLPKSIQAEGYENIKRAFRDTEELAVSSILTETIDKALHSTNCLVVICSTDAPSSAWVDREVAVFIELGRADHIYPLLISGDPEVSFPPSLKLIPDIAERTMDIRVPGNPVKQMMAKADTELLKVIAGITGCNESDLAREHSLRKNRQFRSKAIAAATAFLLIGAVSLGLMLEARAFRDTAMQREEASMRILKELTYDLPDHLTNVPGSYGKIKDILHDNTEDINQILSLSRNKEKATYEAAANYEKLANAESVLGMYDDALASEETAIGLFQGLADKHYERGEQGLASAYNNKASLLTAAGRYDEADATYTEAIAKQETMAEPDPLIFARTYYNAGANAVNLGDGARAAEFFEKSLTLIEPMEETDEVLESKALIEYNYGILLYRSGMFQDASVRLKKALELYQQLQQRTDSLLNRASVVQAGSMLAACLMDSGNFAEADMYYTESIAMAEELAKDDENKEYQLMLAELYNNRGLAFNIQGDYDRADEYYTKATDIYGNVSGQTGTAADQASYALSLLNTGENAFKAGDYERSRALFEQGLALYEAVAQNLGTYDTAQYYAWLSYYELIHERNPARAVIAGETAVRLQPDNILTNMNYAYALLYYGRTEESDALLDLIAAQGEGQVETIRRDFIAQKAAGLESEHRDEILARLGGE